MNQLPDPTKIVVTIGVASMQRKDEPEGDYMFTPALLKAVCSEYSKQPDEDTTGGNDKRFFTLRFRGKKLFAAENEIGGLTVMLPEEY